MDSTTTTASAITSHKRGSTVTLHFFITDPITKKVDRRSALALCTGKRAVWGDITHWLYIHTKNNYENWCSAQELRDMQPTPDGVDDVVEE